MHAPAFNVNPETEGVWGWDWPAGTELDIIVGDPGDPAYTDTVQTSEWGDFGTGIFYDIAPGDTLTLTDGETSKSTTVTSLVVEGVDPDTDTVWGTADPGAEVQVDAYGMAWRQTVADPSTGEWSVDFTAEPAEGEGDGTADLGRGTEGEARTPDDDGDSTAINWRVPDTSFDADPGSDGVWGWDWEAGSVVEIVVGDPGSPAHVAYAPVDDWGNFGTGIEYDLLPGDTLTVSDGLTTKTHTITELVVLGVDPDTDTVFGTATPGSSVDLDAWGMAWRRVIADPSTGEWIAFFGEEPAEKEGWGTADIGRGTEGQARQGDEDGDGTVVPWRVPDIAFNVNPDTDDVWGWDWPAIAGIDIFVGVPGDLTLVGTTGTDEWGNFGMWVEHDLVAGETVTVTDGETTKVHVVTDLAVEAVDTGTELVWGTAAPGSTVQVEAWGMASRTVTADESTGEWTADFSVEPLEEEGWGTADIGRGTEGEARQADEDNDGTALPWRVPDTAFRVDPRRGDVWGWDWQPFATIQITVGDPGDPDLSMEIDASEGGDFGANLGYDLVPGELVTVTDGATTKSTLVTELVTEGADPDTDIVWGTAAPGSDVEVHVYDDWGGVYRQVAADSVTGEWSADFSVPVGSEPHEQAFDIGLGTEGSAAQIDDDNDGTEAPWRIPNPSFMVDPGTDVLEAWDWMPDSFFDIYVGDPGSPDQHLQVGTDEWGNVWTDLGFDAQAGDVFTVTDGETTKVHVVTPLVVDGVDPDSDVVFGTAEPGSDVFVEVWDEWGSARWTTADGTGYWAADFSVAAGDEPWQQAADIGPGMEGRAIQWDEDADMTAFWWRIPNPTFRVDPETDTIDGWEWSASSAVEVFVGDEGSPDAYAVAVADAYATDEGVALTVPAPGILGNDSVADGDPITAALVSTTSGGTLALSPGGGFVYTPAPAFAGTDTFSYRAFDGEDYSNTVVVTITVRAAPVVPIEGENRFETAVEASVRAYPMGLDPDGPLTVVIATGRNWPDALGGASLAGALDGPVLLVDTSIVPDSVEDEIDRLGAEKAIILGGPAAVGPAVEGRLEAVLGDGNVERIAGATRYQTADAVAVRVIDELGAAYDGVAFVATGGNFPDALAAAPLAASRHWPLYLSNPGTGLSAATRAAMAGVEEVLILGGTAVVPTAVETGLIATYGAEDVTRLAGANRYATAVAVATHGVQHAGLGWDCAGIATGQNFPDALAGGVLQGKMGSIMLLTKSTELSPETAAALSAHKAEIDSVTFFGGASAVSQEVRDAVDAALQ